MESTSYRAFEASQQDLDFMSPWRSGLPPAFASDDPQSRKTIGNIFCMAFLPLILILFVLSFDRIAMIYRAAQIAYFFNSSALSFGGQARLQKDQPSLTLTSKTVLAHYLETEISQRIHLHRGEQWRNPEIERTARQLARSIAVASVEYGIDPFLLVAMAEVESGFDRNALGKAGEIGLLQIKPSTAHWIVAQNTTAHNSSGRSSSRLCNLRSIACNAHVGAMYLAYLKARSTDSWNQSDREHQLHILRSYNLGPAKAHSLKLTLLGRHGDRLPSSLRGKTSGSRWAKEHAALNSTSYAQRISTRADQMRQAYLQMALRESFSLSREFKVANN